MKRALLALMLLSCGPAEVGDEPQPPKPFDGTVTPGGTTSLLVALPSTAAGQVVTWSVDPGGGTITPGGLYTAPSCAQLLAALPPGTDVATAGLIVGTEQVHATWSGGQIEIPVTVSEVWLGIAVDPTRINTTPGGQQQETWVNRYTCHDQRVP